MPFTLSVNGSVLKSTNLGSTALDPMLSASVFGVVQMVYDAQQFPTQVGEQTPSFGRLAVIQFLRLVTDQDITVKIDGGSIPLGAGGDLLLVRTNLTPDLVRIDNQSGNVCNLTVIAGGN